MITLAGIRELLDLFDRAGFYRVDRMIGRIETLIRYRGPSKATVEIDFGVRTEMERPSKSLQGAAGRASRLRDELDFNFGRLLEERYSDIVPATILTTNLFYKKHFAEWRRDADGSVRKAAVLVIDSMRLDIWREVIRPALEGDYEVQEAHGFAVLPSETKYSRRAFFAGEPPSATSRGAETELFARMLTHVHGKPVEFEEMSARPSAMSFCVRLAFLTFPTRYPMRLTGIPHTLHEVQRPLVTEIRALLREIGEETLGLHYRRPWPRPAVPRGTGRYLRRRWRRLPRGSRHPTYRGPSGRTRLSDRCQNSRSQRAGVVCLPTTRLRAA